MPSQLTRFRIEGLHGRRTFDIPIDDNRLVLVGENGTGKSTVSNLIYYLLTLQWDRISEYKFDVLQVTISGQVIALIHSEVESLTSRATGHLPPNLRVHYPPQMIREVQRAAYGLLYAGGPSDKSSVEEMIASDIGISVRIVRMILAEMEEAKTKLPPHVLSAISLLKDLQLGQFLYLPTYRRIEQDLKSIFRGIDIEEKVRELRQRLSKRESRTFIELIEFGMEDVEKTIQIRMSQTKESVRTGLSNLTGTYLREVIRGVQESADVDVLRSIGPKGFQSIFARIDDAILPPMDKQLLERKVTEIASGYILGPEDKVMAHFLSKLAALHQEQQKNESDVRDFVQLCNAYLTGKELVYDDVKYSLFIKQIDPISPSGTHDRLELKMLSSGEKQIVSLFSHIYLSGNHPFFVIIDEPELSLSVPWQERFLPDIINTQRCTGIIAVTHSPFIWENELEKYVRPLAQFIEPTVVH